MQTQSGLVVELVDTADLKSAARLGRDGSSPSEATTSAYSEMAVKGTLSPIFITSA